MEAVCAGKHWDVALTQGGALPYLIGKRLGMRFVVQPQLTQYNGPWYDYPEGLDENHRLAFEKEVAGRLVDQLSHLRLAYFQQNFAPSVTNWLPFHWRGFSQTTRYTYRIDDISDQERVFAAFDRDKRQKKIRKSETGLRADLALSPDAFADFHQRYWRAKGQKDLLSHDFIVRVCSTAMERGQGMILAARSVDDGILRGARFAVWDDNSAYSLLSALNPDGHDNGVSAWMFWQLMLRLKDKTRAFDFEGSMDEGVEYSYRLYGAVQTPYSQVSRCFNPLFGLLMRLKK